LERTTVTEASFGPPASSPPSWPGLYIRSVSFFALIPRVRASPSAKRTPSMMFDLPEPFGPVTTVKSS